MERWSKSSPGNRNGGLAAGFLLDIALGSNADLLQSTFAEQIERPLPAETLSGLQEKKYLSPGVQPVIPVEDIEHEIEAGQNMAMLVELPPRKSCRLLAFFAPCQKSACLKPLQHRRF
jgi:hypothetical protein